MRIQFPEYLESERLSLVAAHPRYEQALYKAILDSLTHLQPWMAWANPAPTATKIELYLLEAWRRCKACEEFPLLILTHSGELVGGTGLHRICWDIPKAEIGYWLHQDWLGQGFATEAVSVLVDYGFTQAKFERLEIRASVANYPSRRIPEKLGFSLEGILHRERREQDGSIGDTALYAKLL